MIPLEWTKVTIIEIHMKECVEHCVSRLEQESSCWISRI